MNNITLEKLHYNELKEIVKSYCTVEYDREGRITKRTSVCDGQKEVVVVRYLSSNGFSSRLYNSVEADSAKCRLPI